MLIQNSFDLNSVQLYTDSLKEGLKKTMLDQEIIFRKQVQELHRLYGMQKILTENMGLKQPDGYNFEKACTRSWFYSSNLVRHEQSANLVEDAKSASTAMVGSTYPNSKVFPDKHNGAHYGIYQNPVDHLLPANRCTSNVDEQVLNLSLSIGLEGNGMKRASSTCFDLKNISCCQSIINLEESTEGISNQEANYAGGLSFAAVTKSESQISILSEQIISCIAKNNVSREIEESISPFGNRECHLEENSPGYQKCRKALTVKKSSMQNEQCISHEAGRFDLNQVQFDDSCYSSDNILASHSTASSSHIFGISFDCTPKATFPSMSRGKESCKSSYEASDILQWDDTINSDLINSHRKSEATDPQCHDIVQSEDDLRGNKAVSQIGSCNDLGHCSSDPENRNVRSILRRSHGEYTDPDSTNMITRPVNCENCNTDESLNPYRSPSEVKNGDGHILTTSCKSSCTVDNSGGIKTGQSQMSLGAINLVSPDQHLGTENGSELGHDSLKKKEPPEVDMCMQIAAQLLINFSLDISSSNQDSSSKIEYAEVERKEMDSYEQIALELEECNADDYCVSSKPYEIEGLKKKDSGFKLKRGRRLKDFQREILPGITSLARHEIEEDINIMEAVLRSREYRKINNRMADQRSWCAPVRSRRSKRNYVRRRIF